MKNNHSTATTAHYKFISGAVYLLVPAFCPIPAKPSAFIATEIAPNPWLPCLLWWALNHTHSYITPQKSVAALLYRLLAFLPLVFKGINRQLANCREKRGYAWLSNSLRLLTTAALLSLSEALVAYICRHSTRLEIRRHQLCQQSAARPWGATSAYLTFISTSALCWFWFWWEYKSGTETVS